MSGALTTLTRTLAGAALTVAAMTASAATPEFEALTGEAGVAFVAPARFHEVEVPAQQLLPHELALQDADGKLQIRVALRPLGRIEIRYDDPHGAMPNPEHIYPLLFESLTSNLARGGLSHRSVYSADDAREKFGADWAAAAIFDLDEPQPGGFQQGMLLALHRSKTADAYLLLLFNDAEAARPLIHKAMASLRFGP